MWLQHTRPLPRTKQHKTTEMKTKKELEDVCKLSNKCFSKLDVKLDERSFQSGFISGYTKAQSQFQQEWIPVVAVQDESGHWYVIPKSIEEAFMADVVNDEISDNGVFDDMYGQHRTGGDLNLVQLYIPQPYNPTKS
jgi:hypothetical protein